MYIVFRIPLKLTTEHSHTVYSYTRNICIVSEYPFDTKLSSSLRDDPLNINHPKPVKELYFRPLLARKSDIMFFTGAVGALLMYSVLKGAHHHRSSHEQRMAEQGPISQSVPERLARRQEKHHEELNSPSSLVQASLQNAIVPQVVYVPRETIREVVVDCSCKCACKAPEKPEVPRSFWSLDQGKFVRSAGDKEAKRTREKMREEIATKMKYWSLDQGMHADEKGTV
jgi:hypothetical protein